MHHGLKACSVKSLLLGTVSNGSSGLGFTGLGYHEGFKDQGCASGLGFRVTGRD